MFFHKKYSYEHESNSFFKSEVAYTCIYLLALAVHRWRHINAKTPILRVGLKEYMTAKYMNMMIHILLVELSYERERMAKIEFYKLLMLIKNDILTKVKRKTTKSPKI